MLLERRACSLTDERASIVEHAACEKSLVIYRRPLDHSRDWQIVTCEHRRNPAGANQIDDHTWRRPVEAVAHDSIDVAVALSDLAHPFQSIADVAEHYTSCKVGLRAGCISQHVHGVAVTTDAIERL